MPRIRTLTQLTAQVRFRADMENTDFVTDAEIEQYLQDSVGELWDVIIEGDGQNHFLTTFAFNTEASVGSYVLDSNLGIALPEGLGTPEPIYKVVSVQADLGGSDPVKLNAYTLWEQHRLRTVEGWSSAEDIRYRLSQKPTGNPALRIDFAPLPAGVHEVTIYYIPSPPVLLDGTQTLQSFSGWDEYVIADAAAKCIEKEEGDARHLYMRKNAAELRIRQHAQSLNLDGVSRVRNVDTEGN